MKKIDEGFDNLLNSKYELYSVLLSELKTLAKSWYNGININEFDERFVCESDEKNFITMKKAGNICNYFFAYKEGDRYFLMDGFNRLFTPYGENNKDCIVYLKILVDKLEDYELMSSMLYLNLWKLNDKHREFKIKEFLDRGMRLFLYSKFNINFYNRDRNSDYKDRKRYDDDYNIIDYYFIDERDFCGDFKHTYENVVRLLSHKNVINDIKEILKCNDYLNMEFKNYDRYLHGFIMFLSWKRVSGDDGEYKFETYLNKLYEDKKFFKKLQGMSWTDSTRKCVYNFYRNLK